jgi:hypothetical protein
MRRFDEDGEVDKGVNEEGEIGEEVDEEEEVDGDDEIYVGAMHRKAQGTRHSQPMSERVGSILSLFRVSAMVTKMGYT